MLVSQFASGVSPEFSLVRVGNQVVATLYYGLEGTSTWNGDITASIGTYQASATQKSAPPLDLEFYATLATGITTDGAFMLHDNNAGIELTREFTVTRYTVAGSFTGTNKADYVFGSTYGDTFQSLGAGDVFEGGMGDDLYRVYSADVRIIEDAGQGTNDRVAAGVSYTLAAGVEIEQLTTNGAAGTAAINLTGNLLAQSITGNAGANILSSGGGQADRLSGLAGNDTYRVYNAADVVVEAAGNGTADRVMAAVSYKLAAGAEIELLTTNGVTGTAKINLTGNEFGQTIIGNAANNLLEGGGGDDTLSGGGGNDTLRGGTGNDTYLVDSSDQIGEGGVGNDRVIASSSFDIGSDNGIEWMMTSDAKGTGAINLYGSNSSQTIIGNAGANMLFGRGGDDILIGGAGADRLEGDVSPGGYGNDTASYETASEAVTVDVSDMAANTGDAAGDVFVSIEKIIGTSFDDTLKGAGHMEAIYGGAGSDTIDAGKVGANNPNLDGGAGYDYIYGSRFNDRIRLNADGGYAAGGLGNDFYHVTGAANEDIVEVAGQGTKDVVATSSSYVLSADLDIEVMQTTNRNGTTAINLTGNQLRQSQILGNAGSNVLDGKGGSDVLDGAAGKDFFAFTTALAADNVDTILNFSAVDDTIRLENAIFTALTVTGPLAASAFRADTTGLAQDADDRIIYETTTGRLFYDEDGVGGASAIQFAVLSGTPTITNADFQVI